MPIFMGLLSALCWGSTDFLAGHAARKLGVAKSLFYSQFFGFGLLTIIVFLFSEGLNFDVGILAYIICTAASLCNLLAMVFLLKALSIGKSSIVAPIASLYGAVTTILSLLSGKPLTVIVIISLFICVVGACLTSIPKSSDKNKETLEPIFFAFLSSLMFGIGFWLQGEYAVKDLGVLNALWVYYLTAIVILFLVLLKHSNLSVPPIKILSIVFSISFFSLIGFASLAYGASTGHVAIVTVLSSLASGVTALLGFFIRGERLSRIQIAGIITIIFGVMLLKA
ncbi:DMT family transporter [Xenorhabdus sp. 12]|uniref:DMT family transporter n=1 Tax=Xenorhabdus santafensis TaxID=2582833 RepID=A0ABU4S699_9GAMM|nr:DMT family transporter [Xenorhabdus sp. 12]MDX7986178.1 DMT family transporter [Xenorhabdus sp. 12]